MRLLNKMDWTALTHEYGCDAKRLHPWPELATPFGGAWAVVRKNTTSLGHRNEPSNEEEMFIVASGRARVCIDDDVFEVEAGDMVFIPAGAWHFITNPYGEDVHVYCLWWDPHSVKNYLENAAKDAK